MTTALGKGKCFPGPSGPQPLLCRGHPTKHLAARALLPLPRPIALTQRHTDPRAERPRRRRPQRQQKQQQQRAQQDGGAARPAHRGAWSSDRRKEPRPPAQVAQVESQAGAPPRGSAQSPSLGPRLRTWGGRQGKWSRGPRTVGSLCLVLRGGSPPQGGGRGAGSRRVGRPPSWSSPSSSPFLLPGRWSTRGAGSGHPTWGTGGRSRAWGTRSPETKEHAKPLGPALLPAPRNPAHLPPTHSQPLSGSCADTEPGSFPVLLPREVYAWSRI